MRVKTAKMLDFTSGSIPRHLINFSYPLFLGNLLQSLYNAVDTMWVGKFLGPNSLAAVSVSFPIIFILVSLIIGLSMATTVLVGQYKGAKNETMVKKTINNSMLLLSIAAGVLTVLGIVFHKAILILMNTPEAIMESASGYLIITFVGLIFVFGYNTLSAVLRGLGDSKTPLVFLLYTTVINIVLDPIFIFGLGPIPRMGVNGAALATIVAQGISFYLAVRYLNRSNHLLAIKISQLKYDKDLTSKIFKIGLPAGLQHTVVALGSTVVMSITNTFGETIVAAWGAASKIDSFAFMPFMSIGLATSSLTAQNIGAGKTKRVIETMKWSSLIAIIIAITTSILIWFFPQELLRMFTDEMALLQEGTAMLRILSLSYVPFSMLWVSNGVIRGAGDTFVIMIISIVSLWGIRIPLAYYLSGSTQLGSNGIWAAISISSTLSAIFSLLYYFSGRWKNKSIIQERFKVLETIQGDDDNK
ncbi:MAG: MATE family efflux transporter [Thermoanaerobacterales bacterium]|jgi:putative MATE family efflux protein|nr:MATE family efflux transporter [Thermoanaerobacterales bacterium]